MSVLRDVAVADLSPDECVVELRRVRTVLSTKEECEFVEISNKGARRRLCDAECHCRENRKREQEILQRMMPTRKESHD